ncbi:MAG: hypothetical protein K8F25_16050 [Fimbriimonadaceae bacterium]|nr:hypothetical protein [Alphaproteobacteria bacterium]
MIAYNGRIWFVNNRPFVNFNAADIYSFAPQNRDVRYERGLASQDIGQPVVHGGQLYWPYEDPRSNLALGEYAQTDGANWVLNVFTQGRALHVHAMTACGGFLVAGTGGWVGALQASADDGNTWHEIYRFATQEDQLSRITDVIAYGDACYFAVTARDTPGPKLYAWRDGQAVAVPGWPSGFEVSDLTVVENALYGIHLGVDGREVWRFDGVSSARVPTPSDEILSGLGASEGRLLLITNQASGGSLWVYDISNSGPETANWVRVQTFSGQPVDVLAVKEDIYVGIFNQKGRGELWGPQHPTVLRPGNEAVALKPANLAPIAEETILATERTLLSALQSAGDYAAYRRRIVEITLPLILTRDPKVGRYYSSILSNVFPDVPVATFTGIDYEIGEITRWIILNLIAINGNGQVPVDWLQIPWTRESGPSEKYFDKVLAAIWTVGWIGQNDRETIAALIENLLRPDTPEWFRGDNIASLTALTGRRFGYDVTAWKNWWEQAGTTWPN